MLDDSYGFDIVEWESTFRIRPFFDYSKELDLVGYIKWNEQDYDTLEFNLVQQSKNARRLVKIIYNGAEFWNEVTSSVPDYRYFQIAK